MAKKLDKERDFGEIAGDAGEAKYFQDGLYFDAKGNEIVAEVKKAAAPANKKAAAPVKEPEQPVTVDSQVEEMLK